MMRTRFCGVDSWGLLCFPWTMVKVQKPLKDIGIARFYIPVTSQTDIDEIRRDAANVVQIITRVDDVGSGRIIDQWSYRKATFMPEIYISADGSQLEMALHYNDIDIRESSLLEKVILFEDEGA